MLRRFARDWTRIRPAVDARRVMFIGALAVAASVTTVMAATACGGARSRPAPNVTGERLDAAENTLDAEGLRYHAVGGGVFGIVVRSHWLVCGQRPHAPVSTTSVTLIVGRSCPANHGAAIPDVTGEDLNDAEVLLEQRGVRINEESVEGEPILVKSLWIVCDQSPEAGAHAKAIDLYVGHDASECDEYTSW